MIQANSNKLIFKSEFFDEHEQKLINEMLVNWNEFLAHFEELCKKLEKSKDRHNIYVIDGSIAAGKTTLINNICKANDTIRIIPEPIDIWKDIGIMDDNENKFINILELFYLARNDEKDKKYVFIFQVIVSLSRIQSMINKFNLYNGYDEIIVMERHPFSDKIFFQLSIEIYSDSDFIKKYQTLLKICDKHVPNYQWIFVGMHMNPSEHEFCVNQHIKNLKKRNRSEEIHIPMEYMKSLYNEYVNFVNNLKKTYKWTLDYSHNEHQMCTKALDIFEFNKNSNNVNDLLYSMNQ